jgi:hypothetical protein
MRESRRHPTRVGCGSGAWETSCAGGFRRTRGAVLGLLREDTDRGSAKTRMRLIQAAATLVGVEGKGLTMTCRRRAAVLGAFLLAALSVFVGTALAAKTYPDAIRDVKGGAPDIVSVRVSNSNTKITFAFRFAAAPPLRVSAHAGWVDMLLLGIDVPPLGPVPVAPGGDWSGADLAAGTHGPSATGVVVRLPKTPGGRSRQLARFPIVTTGSTLTFSIPRSLLGGARWFTFTVAAARESAEESGDGAFDVVPAHGTLRYVMTA